MHKKKLFSVQKGCMSSQLGPESKKKNTFIISKILKGKCIKIEAKFVNTFKGFLS